ncbi:replication-relaxation family protein [Streptomyces aculeolatus]
MPYANQTSPPDAGLSRLAEQLLPVLYVHRLMSVRQLQMLLQPHTTHPVYLRAQLRQLQQLGLAEATVRRRRGPGERLWYLTGLGAEVVEAAGEVRPRAYRISPQAAASQLQEHTLAVNDLGIAFDVHARREGDECGPLGWEPEIAHRVRDGENRAADEAFLIPDAVISYVRTQGRQRQLLTFFAEVDRCTMPVTALAAKLHRYARYRAYVPAPPFVRGRARPAGDGREAWRARYAAFPALLIVLTGAPDAALARRAADLRALAAADTRLTRATKQLTAGITSLGLLQAHGPFARVVTPLIGDETATDVLLNTPEAGGPA